MRQKIDARHTTTRRWRGLLTLVALIASSSAQSAPSGGQVTAGSGTIEQVGSTTTIDQSSNKLAIDWQNFDIAAGESVRFNQPSSQSIALNRILGQDPTTILGSLSSNGQVFLLNPNGVLFGAGSQVDVGGIFASTQSISDADFLAGRYTFAGNGGAGSVLNQGTIHAADGGYVALGGTSVVNDGVIRAYKGTVALGAGDEITLNIDGDRLVGFNVDKAAVAAFVANKQLIQADGGSVLLSAQAKDALLATVVNNDGIVEARSVSNENGVIRLDGGASGIVAVTGTLDASGANAGEHGGKVIVTGDEVALLDGASIDASGSAGGGAVLVGGDTHGANAAVQNATRTFVASSAAIRADALDDGDAGRVVVWADGDTRYFGSIGARGGADGGDGGFVEVSGKDQLGFAGAVDTSAPMGNVGTLLLDPNDLYISSAAVGGALQDSSNPFQSSDGVNNYYVLASTLTALPANTAVQLQANHDIVFQTNLAMPTTAAGSLTFNAANGIQMGGFDLSTANAGVSMTAGAGGISNLGTITLGTGTLTLDSSGAITQNAGDLIQSTGSLIKQGTGTLTLSAANAYTGATTIAAGTVAVTANNGLGTGAGGTTVSSGATLDLRNVAYATSEPLTLNGGTLATSAGTSSFAGNIALGANSIANVSGTQLTASGVISGATFGIDKQGAGVLVLSGNNTYTGTTSISAGTLRLGAANRIANTSAVFVGGGATFDLNNFAETVGSLAGAGAVTLGSATLTAGGDNTSTNFSGVASGTGGLTKTGTGTLTLSGANSFTGPMTISGGVLRASGGAAIADTSQVSLANTAGVSLDVANDETIGNLSGGGNTGGNVTLNGNALTVNEVGSTTFRGVASGAGGITKLGAGTLTLSGSANTYTGTTTVTAGTLALGAANVLANTSSLVVNGGTFAMGTRSDTLAGVQLQSGSITSSSGVLTSTSDYELQSGSVSAILAGAVSLNKSTGGTVVLSGNNAYTGATNVGAGTLQLGSANRVPNTSAVTVASGAMFDLNNFADTVGSIAGAGTIALGSATLTTGGDGTSTTFSGAINGTGALTKTGAGTLTLSGTNTYTGTTTISAGVLRASGGDAIADTSAVTLSNTAGVALDVANDETIGNLSGGGATGGNVTLNGNTLTVNEGGTTTFAGAASGTGGLTKSGTGTLTLSGANTYTGTTTVNAGGFALSGGNAIADNGAVNLAGGGLTVATAETIGSLVSAAGTTLALTAGLTFGDATNTTVASTISGAGTLTKRGSGSTTLSGANTYTGATAVNAGTLVAANATALGATAAGTTVGSGATLSIANAAVGAEAVTLNGAGAGSAGALTGTGNASLGGAVTLSSATTIGAVNSGDSLTLSGTVNGAQALTESGLGTVAFNGAVGGTMALASFANAATNSTSIGGGTFRTTGTQTYNGALTTTLPTTLTTTNAAISAPGAVNSIAGALTVATGTGAVTMTNAANDFGTVGFTSAGAVNLIDSNALGFATSNVATLRAQTLTGNITVNGALTATGAGDSLVLASGGNFINNVGAGALNPGAGRWLVWSTNPALDTRGGLAYAFKQYNAVFGATTVAGAGNGFLYTLAPTLTPSLTGTVSKTYDGNTTANLLAGNFTFTGAIDGDAVTLNTPTVGAFGDRNVGTGKSVSAGSVSIATATNGAATVYGYQLASTTAAGNVGTITAAPLTITAVTNTKTYDGNVSAAATPTLVGLVGGDTATGLSEVYTDRNVGTGKTLNVSGYTINDGNGGNNYAVTTVANGAGVIDPATLVGSITASNKVYDATTAATIASRTLSGVVAGDSVTYTGGAATFADKNAANGKTVTATGLGLTGADANNYTVNSTATTTADITPLAIAGSITAADKVYDATTAAAIASRVLTGVLSGDTVSYVGGTANFSDKNAALGKTVTATGLSLAGADAGNYSVNDTATTTADITPLAIIGSVTAANKVYDATIDATLTDRALTGVLAGDSVAYSGGTATFADKNAGTGKTVTATGLALTGADAGNYSVNDTATTTADITPLAIIGSVTAANKVYDATTNATITDRSLTGVLAGDTVAYSGGTATFADRNAGSGKTVTATGLSLAGADAGNYTVNSTATTTADITPATLTYVADSTRIERGEPFPSFSGTVAGFVGDDTLANATTGTLAFATNAADSNQIGFFAIDGSGLAANNGNYLFVQAAANANALLITPPGEPEVPGSVPNDAIGAVTTALQTEAVCNDVRGSGESTSTCRGPVSVPVRHAVRVAQHVTPVAGTSFGREGAGIRLPAGASDQ
jgi:filamentous hemagglutinin family protein